MQPQDPLIRAYTTTALYLSQAILSPTAQSYTLSVALVVLTVLQRHPSSHFDLFTLGCSILSLLNNPAGEPWPK